MEKYLNNQMLTSGLSNEESILYLVYHDLRSEERSREILEVLSQIGNTISITKYGNAVACNAEIIFGTSRERKYCTFLKECRNAIKQQNFSTIVIHDNYTAALLPVIKKTNRDVFVIYDSSEFYPVKDLLKISYKSVGQIINEILLRFSERIFITENAINLFIVANKERAIAAQRYFRIKKNPIVFDNIHRIEDDYDELVCANKYADFFDSSAFILVYAGGISKDRETLKIAEAVKKLGSNYKLIVLGNATKKQIKRFNSLTKDNANFIYYGFVTRAELKYLYERAHVGVSAFRKNTLNNIFCASGKTYECLYCGTPIICSANPPFERLCNEFGVGIASDDFVQSISEIKKNYSFYKKNAMKYSSNGYIEKRKANLIFSIRERIEEYYSERESREKHNG